jgi:predicted amidohydrolase
MLLFGKVGIVICFDRHIPESARACAKQGAELILIPTANMIGEPLVLFEYEVRVEALHNTCNIAMCNRVGSEGDCTFAGESMVADPYGSLVYKAGNSEELSIVEIDMSTAAKARKDHPYFELMRPECY